MPDAAELGYDVSEDEMEYKKYPVEHYGWNSVHKWFEMDGIVPKVGDTKELSVKALTDIFFDVNIALNRMTIFILQLGFENNLFDGFISGLNDAMQPIKEYFFDQVFGIITLVLLVIVILKYAQGRKGEGYAVILKAVFYSAVIFGLIDNADWLILSVTNFVNFIAMAVLGAMNFAPLMGAEAAELAGEKIIEISNTIFNAYIKEPWTFGQFATVTDVPVVTEQEAFVLNMEGVSANIGQLWNDLQLQFPTGSGEREAMVKILVDDSITHDPNLDTSMFFNSSLARTLISLLALFLNITGLLLFGATGMLQLVSSLGLMLLTGLLPILVVASFFGDAGERFLRTAGAIWLVVAALKIAAAIYVGIPIMLMTLLDFGGMGYMIAAVIFLIINVLGVWNISKVWQVITPALIRGAVKVSQSIGRAKDRTVGAARGRPFRTAPTQVRSEFRRGKFSREKQGRLGQLQTAVGAAAAASKVPDPVQQLKQPVRSLRQRTRQRREEQAAADQRREAQRQAKQQAEMQAATETAAAWEHHIQMQETGAAHLESGAQAWLHRINEAENAPRRGSGSSSQVTPPRQPRRLSGEAKAWEAFAEDRQGTIKKRDPFIDIDWSQPGPSETEAGSRPKPVSDEARLDANAKGWAEIAEQQEKTKDELIEHQEKLHQELQEDRILDKMEQRKDKRRTERQLQGLEQKLDDNSIDKTLTIEEQQIRPPRRDKS